MSHRLGSIITVPTVFLIGPASGEVPTSPNTWQKVFSPPPAPGGTRFLMLRFTAANLPDNNRLEVDLGYGTDVFTSASGSSFWTRPVAGNSVTIRYIDDGAGPAAGSVSLSQYGRGEGLAGGGATNANGDVFLLDSPFVDPTYSNPAGLCGPRSWENAACLPAGAMREAARRVGMYIVVDGDHLSSCSAALIDADLILTAGHCISTDSNAVTGAITFDFQTNCDGTRPAGYNPVFHKLKRVVRSGFARAPNDMRPLLDYSIVQIVTPPGGLGLAPLPLRPDLPALGETLFAIHHPRGATKKVSRQPADPQCSVASISANVINMGCDVDNGSSGSPLFDASGKIVAVNNWANYCSNGSLSIIAITQDFLSAPEPVRDVDVMLVFDRSGSMSLPGLASGLTKMREAQQAASLFIQLVRSGAGHRVGLVSFSTTPSSPVDFPLSDATEANKTTLIGSPPFTGGVVGGLTPGGMTTIGGGLRAAQMQLPPPTPSGNIPTILLMTDGLQNTPPMIAAVEPEIANTQLHAIGFGSEGSLNGPLLTRLARDHGGLYTRAGDGLALKKFFALAFGNIFSTAISMDPEYVLPAGASAAAPIPFDVCGEDTLTAVLGWVRPGAGLTLSLRTPGGNILSAATPGVVSTSGDTWTFLRLGLPFNGERDGAWQALVTRAGGEFDDVDARTDERFFVTVVVDGGPYFRPLNLGRRYYTGEALNPQAVLLYPDGTKVPAQVTLVVTAPARGTGNLLTETGLRQAMEVDGDQIDARSSTLIALEQEGDTPLVGTKTYTYTLYDDGEHADGAMEADGIYGNLIEDLTRYEGNYTFRARATFGDTCTLTRETSWSTYVSVGIDPQRTDIRAETVGVLPDGCLQVRITFTPRDRYGNYLGPGRLGSFQVDGQPGSEPVGGVRDGGDGSYIQDVAWCPGSPNPPGIVVGQPGRPGLTICDTRRLDEKLKRYGCLVWLQWALIVLLVVLGLRRRSREE